MYKFAGFTVNVIPRWAICVVDQVNGRESCSCVCRSGGSEMFRALDLWGFLLRPDISPNLVRVSMRFGADIRGRVRNIRTSSANMHSLCW